MTIRHSISTLLLCLTFSVPALATQYAVVVTNFGPITVELDDQKAPISVANFEQYAKEGFYDNTVFHRVMSGFMIQGGGYDHHGNYPQGLHSKGAHSTTHPPIANEWKNGLKNVRGSLAMARLGGQADSATNEFFINLVDNDFLDQPRDGAGYAVFGKVVSGMDVVDSIGAMQTTSVGRMANVPTKEVVIKSVAVFKTMEEANTYAAVPRVEAAQRSLADAKAALAVAQAKVEAAQDELDAATKAVKNEDGGGTP